MKAEEALVLIAFIDYREKVITKRFTHGSLEEKEFLLQLENLNYHRSALKSLAAR